MSISVQNITKLYGTQTALNNVSFEVGKNEIVGFLGPNGAGKSTMMKILTCYIPPDKGTAAVMGFDVATASLDVRKHIGYLPEHNPLYLDMYVKESLAFTASLFTIPNASKRVNELIGMTGLEREQHKKIGMLSKGYRQRVGLAQALIHDPAVLILDEPTTGLDPNQLEDIRGLIRNLGKEKTVMLSTHIMQEVEALCNKVIIINQGEIVAQDTTDKLKVSGNRQIISVEFDQPVDLSLLRAIEGVTTAIQLNGNTYKIEAGEGDSRKTIFDFAVKNNLSVLTLTREERGMEDVFRSLTKN
jgi:ABC-2 type transport system ATP-binding protein